MARKAQTSRAKPVLPESFQDLEPFMEWALAKENERTNKRLASTMAEIQAFYDAIFPRMEAMVAYLNQFSLDHLPQGAQQLFYLTLALVEVSSAVELYKQPEVINGFASSRFRAVE